MKNRSPLRLLMSLPHTQEVGCGLLDGPQRITAVGFNDSGDFVIDFTGENLSPTAR